MSTALQRRANDRRRTGRDQTAWKHLVRQLRLAAAREGATKPQVGDLVVEATNWRYDPGSIGVLLGHGWDDRGEVWVIRTRGRADTWHNAEFWTVPARLHQRVPRRSR